MISQGEGRYTSWKKRTQSLSYIFGEEVDSILVDQDIDSVFTSKSGHPTVLKKYLGGDVSIETMIILDKILGYRKQFDNKLTDPVWESVSMKMKKYEPFLNIDVFRYKKVLKQKVLGE